MKKAALLSVSDRTGLIEFAKELEDLGYALLGSSGTKKALLDAGIDCLSIEDYTGQKEILGGRVKTLHPRIYAGILARLDVKEDLAELEQNDIYAIDVVAVNLYPFSANRKLKSETGEIKSRQQMVELIDIGGPSMIRAAAKNHKFVWPAIDPADYQQIIQAIKTPNEEYESSLRNRLTAKVFAVLSRDALDIAEYFSSEEINSKESDLPKFSSSSLNSSPVSDLPEVLGQVLVKSQALRYGENSHQKAAFYYPIESENKFWKQLNGKELSYNNILDLDAALKVVSSLSNDCAGAVIIKHTNPCGVAVADTCLAALQAAKRCDPRSHFGGIIAFNQQLDLASAQDIREDFAEIVVAPSFSLQAIEFLQGNKNLRVIEADFSALAVLNRELRSALGGILIQDADLTSSSLDSCTLASERAATAQEKKDLDLAWRICPHVKSNTIVLVKDGLLIGVGAGQMSRVDSVELAINKAKLHGHDLNGSVAASDAFFPFPDGIETLALAGIKAVIAPNGAKRDGETVEVANKHKVALYFATDRHFRH
jgi:phosphoribosylaminoimidazolecarboxamide formyltransferase/IMP cyclohydrolase